MDIIEKQPTRKFDANRILPPLCSMLVIVHAEQPIFDRSDARGDNEKQTGYDTNFIKPVEKRDSSKSLVEKPCSLTWDIAAKMHAENCMVKRKAVLEACVKAGISYYTARTQYQEWYRASGKGKTK